MGVTADRLLYYCLLIHTNLVCLKMVMRTPQENATGSFTMAHAQSGEQSRMLLKELNKR